MARPAEITRIQTDSPDVNRLQEELRGKLNPILRTLPEGIGTRPTVSGSRSSGAALTSLLEALDSMGLIKDETTP